MPNPRSTALRMACASVGGGATFRAFRWRPVGSPPPQQGECHATLSNRVGGRRPVRTGPRTPGGSGRCHGAARPSGLGAHRVLLLRLRLSHRGVGRVHRHREPAHRQEPLRVGLLPPRELLVPRSAHEHADRRVVRGQRPLLVPRGQGDPGRRRHLRVHSAPGRSADGDPRFVRARRPARPRPGALPRRLRHVGRRPARRRVRRLPRRGGARPAPQLRHPFCRSPAAWSASATRRRVTPCIPGHDRLPPRLRRVPAARLRRRGQSPLLVFLHGSGESGDGSADALANLAWQAIPQYIANDGWPTIAPSSSWPPSTRTPAT